MVEEIGPRARTAFRHARVWLWRFKRSPDQQDRAAMYATFAFIAAFGLGSVDAIITGGADFAPGSAYAAEYRPAQITHTFAPAPAVAVVEEPSTEAPVKTVAVDYSFTTEVLLGGPELTVSDEEFIDWLAVAPAGAEQQPIADAATEAKPAL